MSRLRSAVANARGLGSAKSGTAHFIAERLTALALVPLGLWFVVNVITLALEGGTDGLAIWLLSPLSAALMALFVIFSFWHSKLGIQVIVEDYVHKPFWRNGLLILSASLHILLGLLCVMAIAKLHFVTELPV